MAVAAAEAAKAEVERVARAGGAAVVGVAAVTGEAPAPFGDYPRAVVAAIPLARGVLATCRTEPTRLYAHHYRVVNAALDNVGCRIAAALESGGYEALAVPASQVVDWENMRGAVSHIRLAEAAGLGFVGRHGLLVTPRFGAGVRLTSVFTTAELPPDAPAGGDCGSCERCRPACPAQAVGAAAEEWDREACLATLRDFKKRITNQHICGVCVRVCAEAARG